LITLENQKLSLIDSIVGPLVLVVISNISKPLSSSTF